LSFEVMCYIDFSEGSYLHFRHNLPDRVSRGEEVSCVNGTYYYLVFFVVVARHMHTHTHICTLIYCFGSYYPMAV